MFQNARQNEIKFYDNRKNNFLKLNFFHSNKTKIMMVSFVAFNLSVKLSGVVD